MIRVLRTLLTAALLLTGLFSLTGCLPKTIPIKAGTYISTNDAGSGTVSKIKVVLTQITEEQFDDAADWNVIREYRSDRYIRYYRFELFAFVDALGAYQQLNVVGVEQQRGAPQTYYGEIDPTQETFGISNNFTFYYEKKMISQDEYTEQIRIYTHQDGSAYDYYAELQNG